MNELGPVVEEELLQAFQQIERLTTRLENIKTRIDQLHKEEEELRTYTAPPVRTGLMALFTG